MDLNASPLPEDEEEEEEYVFEEQEHEEHRSFEPDTHRYPQPQSVHHPESSVETLRREREERRQRLKREHPDERPKRVYQPPKKAVAVENKTTRFYDRDKLPHGWLDCPASGKAIGFMIPSKVPLGEYFHDFIVPGKRYSLRQVIHQQRVLGRELGLVIDLTNTTRYYPPADWKKQGIKHVKIACRGRDSVPDHESVNNFVYEVLQFSARQKHTKKFVLVHCTHGHNRTGFMIVHFLMRSQPMSVTKAIQIFANARPPGIYKQDYIDALYAFYHEKPEAAVCPPTPEWKRSSNLDLNGEAVPDDDGDDDDDGVAAPLHEDHVLKEVMTNDDILGDAIPYEQQEAMRQFCYQSLKLGAGAKGTSQFPGSHPVSLNRENLQLLRQRYYYATWKADGTRYMMLITCDGCYLIDRNFNFRRVQMRFPSKQPNDSGLATHNLTLLDGEMVIDTHPDTRKQERRYLIYDLIAVNQVSVVERPFCERWKMLEEEVIQPRNIEREKLMMFENEENQQRKIELERQFTQQNINPYYIYEMEPFRVRRKGFWLLSTVTKLLEKFIPGLSHEADGLIFQGWDDPYVPRTHEGLLKWKYAEMNSVDFLFELVDDNRPQLFLYERGRKKLMEGNLVVFRDESDPSTYSGKIIECSWDSEEGVWVCMRIRVDKSTPNDFNTYKKVMRSIKDNITEEVLLKEIDEIVRLPMYTDRTRKIPLRK